ncbi:hypothetical protein TNCV_3472711 [Trichonephila clavipes]|nr:hypothetical protein TNCV_3472711 [Trichonephila clavipes]
MPFLKSYNPVIWKRSNKDIQRMTDFISTPARNKRSRCGMVLLGFEDSLAMGKNATNYDGEVLAVYEATTQLLAAGLVPA